MAACEEYKSTLEETYADDEWAYRCMQRNGAVTLEWAFYAFGSDAPPARLQQFRATVPGSQEILGATYQLLAPRLTAQYGTGSDPGQDLREFGSAYWINTLRWRTDELDVYLYRDPGDPEPNHVGVLARTRSLVDVIAQDETRFFSDRDWPTSAARRLDMPLSAALQDQFPELLELFARLRAWEEAGGEWPRDRVRAALVRLVTTAKSASDERKAALLLAAERLGHFWKSVPAFSGGDTEREELGRLGLGFAYNQLGGAWIYGHDLLWRVWRDHGGTEWGERAFVLLLHYGWGTGVGCSKGSDQFLEVIRQSEAFLAQRPQSPRRLEVVFPAAQAYEAWWSLSKIEENTYVRAADYQQGADAAREKAIRYYEEVVSRAPGSAEAAFARRQLPRLKLKVATGQFRFVCVYD